MRWIKSFFEEDNGKASSKRLYAGILILLFSISYLRMVFKSGTLVDIPDNWAMLIGGVILGLGALRKIAERKKLD